MKPGHGEILIAEGDVEVPEEHDELVAAFRAQLDAGHVGGRAAWRRPAGGGRRRWCRASTTSRRTPIA